MSGSGNELRRRRSASSKRPSADRRAVVVLVVFSAFWNPTFLRAQEPPQASTCKMALAHGYVEVRRARFPEALAKFQEAMAGGGDCLVEAHLGLAATYNSTNEHKKALKAAETALHYAEDPEIQAEAHYQIGRVWDQRGARMTKKKARALTAFEQALELSGGEHTGAVRALMRIYKETKDSQKLAAMEEKYPRIRVATVSEQRRAVRPEKKPPPEAISVAEASQNPDAMNSEGSTPSPGTNRGPALDCSTGNVLSEAELQAKMEGYGARPVGGIIEKPEKLSTPQAQYPEEDRRNRVQGVVVVTSLIDTEGKIALVRVEQGVSPAIDQSAVDAICRWRFEPARDQEGNAVAVFYGLTVNFRVQ